MTMVSRETMITTCRDFLDEMTTFFDKLIRFESVSSYEGPAMEWLYHQFKDISDECELVPIPEDIMKDPDYSFRVDDRPYKGRCNVRVVLKGDGTGKSVIINDHIDVAPPSVDHIRPFDPYVENDVMYGRGTCDDKGQTAVIWTLFSAFKKLGLRPQGDIIVHFVLEEETGGNGTLAMIRRGEKADCCIVLEPCENNVLVSTRGAVWFTGTVYGTAGHSGSGHVNVSAIKMAYETIKIMEDYSAELLKNTHGNDPLFLKFQNPMPMTVGQLDAGVWPSIVPQKAVFKGVFGLLTTSKEEVMREIVNRVKTMGPEWLRDHFEMAFPYRHDTCRIDPGHSMVKLLIDSYREVGVTSEVSAANYGADAWFYNNLLGIPTVMTGCGSIKDAHTSHEQVVLKDIVNEASALALFIQKWCGLKQS
jgi:acetylornithine deacetylase